MARQRKKGNPIVTAVIFGIFGIVLLFLGIRTFIGLHGTLLNVTTCDPSEIKPGIYVEGTISYGYGAYIEKTTTYNHIVTKTDGYYYLVDICDKNADGSDNDTARWIGISISKSDNDKFDAISTQDDAPPIEITGVIRKNSSKVQGFLDDYITSYVDMYASYYDYTATSEDYANAKAEAFPYYRDGRFIRLHIQPCARAYIRPRRSVHSIQGNKKQEPYQRSCPAGRNSILRWQW